MPPNGKDMRIAVMGSSGSGKTTFINLASSSTLPTAGGLASCTSDVDTAKPFLLDGRIVTLIDTPGFDHTTRSDMDVLQCLVGYLEKTYERGTKLAGIVYMYRISDDRIGETSTRIFRNFRDLCGECTFRNVLIVTNFWGEIEPAIGEKRENELANHDRLFKPVLKRGARLLRHDDTQASAHAILRKLIGKEDMVLRIQKEIVDEHKVLSQTVVGAELACDLTEQVERHQKELKRLREEMDDALSRKDEETMADIQEVVNKVRQENERMKRNAERVDSDFAAEKAEFDAKIAEMETENWRRVQDEAVHVREEAETVELADAQCEAEMPEHQREAKEETARLVDEELRLEMVDALRRKDEEARAEIQEEINKVRQEKDRTKRDAERMVSGADLRPQIDRMKNESPEAN